MENKLDIFIKRLQKIGIQLELIGNFPWVYLDKVNGVKITKRYYSKYGYTIMFVPIKLGQEHKFLDGKDMFDVIRQSLGTRKT